MESLIKQTLSCESRIKSHQQSLKNMKAQYDNYEVSYKNVLIKNFKKVCRKEKVCISTKSKTPPHL